MILNTVIALCISPANHRKMELSARCENALTGFILVDLFSLVAQVTCRRLNWGKGLTWLAPQTASNLQQVCLSIISVAVGKSPQGDPWVGTNRMNEVSVEEHFGRLRVQASNAQMTARSYWRAVARESLLRKDKVQVPRSLTELPPLSEGEFQTVCDRAFRASLDLVSHCSDYSVSTLEKMYRDACDGQAFDMTTLDSYKSHPMEAEDGEILGDEEDVGEESNNLLKNIQADAACFDFSHSGEPGEDAEKIRELEKGKEDQDDDLGDVPDVDQLREAAAAEEAPGESMRFNMSSRLPVTLGEAIAAVESGRPFFDSIWKLALFLRHG